MQTVPLDLYRCGQRFRERVAKQNFGMRLVKVAKEVVWFGMNEEEQSTLEKCLVSLINSTEYSQSIGFLPFLYSYRQVNAFGAENEEVEYVAKSLIETTKLYETQLSVLDTRYVVARGLEWSIDAIERGIISIIIGPMDELKSLKDFDKLPFLTSTYIAEWQESVRKASQV